MATSIAQVRTASRAAATGLNQAGDSTNLSQGYHLVTSPATSPPTDRLARFGRPALGFLGQAVLWALLWLSLIRLPQPPSAGLDPSWRLTLDYAFGHHLQFGTDLVFTYGPLGYLLAGTTSGEHYLHYLIWQIAANAIFATVIWLFGRSFRGWKLAAYYAYFFFLGTVYVDAVHIILVLLLSLALLREPVAARRWLVAIIGFLLAVLALVKFTNLMLASFVVACVLGHHAWRRRWVDLGLIAGSFGASFVLGWMLWGQRPANIFAYLVNSFSVSTGYVEGMAFDETTLMLMLGLGAAFTLGAYYVLTLWRRDDPPRAIAVLLMAAAASYLNWKHGFVRADGHVFAHFVTCLFMAASFPVLLQDDGPLRRLKAGLLWGCVAFSLIAVYSATPSTITDAPAIWNYHLKEIVNALRIAPDLGRNARNYFEDMKKLHALPAVKTAVDEATIDMLGNEQAYVLFNGLNFTPHPALQSYSPYTERLLKLDEEFYRSSRGPEFVLQKIEAIDLRLPAVDDSLATRYLYHHYTYVLQERGFLLWRRNRPDPGLDEKTPLSSTTLAFSQNVAVPDRGDAPIWVEIDARPSLLGRLRTFLYKPPTLNIALTDGRSFKSTYRLISGMARAGFLLHPFFTGNNDVVQFETGNPTTRPASFSLEMPPAQRKYFQRDIGVRFFMLKPFPRTSGAAEGSPDALYRSFNHLPSSVIAHFPVSVIEEEGQQALFAHPPSTIEFKVDFPATRLSGKFGFTTAAYTPPNTTDGAEFLVKWIGADGSVITLFDRLLRPRTEAKDRGMQSFEVSLPPGGGRVILQITPGPNGDLSFDWTYWTRVKFE
jgi:hypothetical protein